MKFKITAFLAAWLTIASSFVYAQQYFKITGKITGSDNKPLEGATVYLKRATDSALVKTELADASGNFVFNNQKSGDYRLTITMVGYAGYKSDIFQLNADKDLPVINLAQAGTALKDVTVSSQKPLIEHKIDRTV